jgi:hypothetical protein
MAAIFPFSIILSSYFSIPSTTNNYLKIENTQDVILNESTFLENVQNYQLPYQIQHNPYIIGGKVSPLI